MRRAFRRHRRELVAPLVLMVMALFVVGYILAHQPAFHAPPWLDSSHKDPYIFNAEFSSAPAIVAGQGQTVDIAGVPVGDVKALKLRDGRAVLELELERTSAPIYRDATILLRPKTPLKDMYLALDPGTPSAGALPEGGTLSVSQTQPDVNYDEILSNLDSDTRAYLKILLGSAAQGLRDPGGTGAKDGAPSPGTVADLQGTYKRIEPLGRDAEQLFAALAARRRNLRRVVHSFEQIASAVADVDTELGTLIDASSQTFSASASRDRELQTALAKLPATLEQTKTALGGVTQLAQGLAPTLTALRPSAEGLAPALKTTRAAMTGTVPVIRNDLRPFAKDVQPVVAALRPATRDVAATLPPLTDTLHVVNRLFNALAYNPKGQEEGFLFWGTWLSHIGPSLLTAQDAHGATPRALLLATCAQLDALHQVELGSPSLGPILKLLNPADRLKVCPQSAAPVFTK